MTEIVVGWTTGRSDSDAGAGRPRQAGGKPNPICCVTVCHVIQVPMSVTGVNPTDELALPNINLTLLRLNGICLRHNIDTSRAQLPFKLSSSTDNKHAHFRDQKTEPQSFDKVRNVLTDTNWMPKLVLHNIERGRNTSIWETWTIHASAHNVLINPKWWRLNTTAKHTIL